MRHTITFFELVLVGILGILVGHTTTHLAEARYLGDLPRPPHRLVRPPPPRRAFFDDIVRRNIFCSSVERSPGGGPHIQPSALGVELVATMRASDEAWSMAVLRELGRHRDAALLGRGDAVFATGAVVERVESRRVYLVRGGRREYIDFDTSAGPSVADLVPSPGIRCQDAHCTVERRVVDAALANPAALSSMARFLPALRHGEPDGFRVVGLRPGSLLAQIGLQNGDTLHGVNGLPLRTLDDAIQLFTRLRTASRIRLAVERGGQPVTYDYLISP